MKVDVYPNITNVEVYENPISVPVEATWEKVVFTVPDPVVASYDLGRKVATDRDGDYVIQLHYNATVQQYGEDFVLDGTNVVWISEVDLAVGEELIVWYSPQSAYGSVPGSGEVTSLTHLNDVTIEGPLAGDMLMRNADGQFVNRKLTAGANVTIVSDGDGVTISSVGGGGGAVVSASTITEGTVRLSTIAEAAGNSDALAVTPAALQNQLATLSAVAQSGQYNDLLGKPALSTVATSGSYNDLDNKPVIPTTQGAAGIVNVSDGNGGFSAVTWEVSNNNLLPTVDDVYDIGSATKRVRDLYIGAQSIKIGDNNTPLGVDANGDLTFGQTNVLTDANLADVATTGAYADLIGAPTLSGVATSGAYGDLIGAPTLSTVATTGVYADLSGAPTLSSVATSGSYDDLIGAPTLSNVATSGAYADLSGTPTISTVGATGNYSDLIGAPTLSTVATSGAYADLSGRPTLSTVATSGSYNDLADKPAIPSASTDLTDSADLARLASPSLTGTPTAPTPTLGDDSNKIATTAYVQDEITNLGGVNSLDDLSDVVLNVGLSAGEVLRYDGANFTDAQLASTDLSDSADVARLASPSFTGSPTAPTAAQGDNTNKIATTSYVQTEITNMSTVDELTDLSDVTLSGTSSAGDVVRYNGAGWVDAQLASTDLSDSNALARTASLGTAASEDVGTAIGDVVQLVDVSGSASLPVVDASQLTGITASQVGALADITNESLNDLSDVDFTAGNAIDSYVLTYSDTNTRWEAQPAVSGPTTVLLSSSNITHAGGNHAFVTVSPNTNYIIDPSVASVQFVYRIYFTVAATGVDDPASVQIVNLSSLPIRVRSTSANVLYDSLGNAAPYTAQGSGGSGYYFEYNKGTVNLFQSDTTGAGAKWYSYFDYALENQSVPSEGDGIGYSEADLANINIGQVFGDYVISADVSANAVRAGRRYVTADTETVSRTISLPNVGASESLCDALDGRLMYFENRGTTNLRVQPDRTGAPDSNYWNYVSKLDGTSQASFLDLRSGESIAVRVERINNKMYYRYIKQGFIPSRITETITATSTISTGTEHHRVVYVSNGATAVTITVPASTLLRDGYQLTLKVLGTGAVTVNRSGTDTFDGDTSLTLGQNDQLSLIESASGWAVLHNDAASGGATSLVTDTSPTLGGDLDVSTFDIVSSSGNDIEIAPDGAGTLIVKGNATGGSGSITLNCEQNSHGVTIKSPPHASNATYTLTLPDDTGSANELLKTDGSGNLSWSAVDADEVVAPRVGTNYTALATDSVTTHLGAIDTALGNVGGGGGGGSSYTYSAISATTTAQAWYHYSVDTSGGAVTLNLPALATLTDGDEIRVKLRVAGNNLTIDANSTENIDGGQTYTLDVAYQSITLVAGSTEWEII